MNTITEKELVDGAQNGAVQRIRLAKDSKGKGFNLYVTLSWKAHQELLLITQHNEPRTWISVDRMLAHMNKHYRGIHEIIIYLEGNEHDGTTEPISSQNNTLPKSPAELKNKPIAENIT